MGIPALQHDIDALRDMARGLAETVPGMRARLTRWHAQADAVTTPQEAESLASDLRRLWLAFAHETAQATTRTPLSDDRPATPSGAVLPFGYERDLTPDLLEDRAADYVPPPSGWQARHVLFASGQSALGAVLLHVAGQVGGRRMRVGHVGTYFETSDLLGLFGAECIARREDDPRLGSADLLILEPTMLGETFRCLDMAALQATLDRHGTPPLVMVDPTLSHLRFPIERMLGIVPSGTLVIRMASMLKLDQAGLELANAGLLSIFGAAADSASLNEAGDRLTKIRSATGTGPTFADVCALDVPWFLDAPASAAYAGAIFAHNAQAARQLDGHELFAEVLHPVLSGTPGGWAEAPFVVLKLAEATAERYAALERLVAERAAMQTLPLRKGGSFGFRMHRYETVEPENEPPFLRVALGASDIAVDEVISLLADLNEDDLR